MVAAAPMLAPLSPRRDEPGRIRGAIPNSDFGPCFPDPPGRPSTCIRRRATTPEPGPANLHGGPSPKSMGVDARRAPRYERLAPSGAVEGQLVSNVSSKQFNRTDCRAVPISAWAGLVHQIEGPAQESPPLGAAPMRHRIGTALRAALSMAPTLQSVDNSAQGALRRPAATCSQARGARAQHVRR